MDPAALNAATGWSIHHCALATSTNDLAARLAAKGAGPRTAVVADEQSAGRGRQGRRFVSPRGGLYASLLLDGGTLAPPGPIVALAGVAAAEAIEAVAGASVTLKWPNDIWVRGRKVGGILVEWADPTRPVVVGIGINIRAVPDGLSPSVRAATGALDDAAAAPIRREALLVALLRRADAWADAAKDRTRLAALEAAWRGRLALLGEPVRYHYAGRDLEGVLEDAGLEAGLLIRDPVSGPVWRQAEHVQDLRPTGRTIA